LTINFFDNIASDISSRLKGKVANKTVTLTPTFSQNSKYYEDVYPSDSIYVNGRVMRPPKYYDKLFKKLDPDLMEQISQTRHDNFDPTDCTPERLKVREICAQAKLSQCSRDAIYLRFNDKTRKYTRLGTL
jgi:hypothetical protein